MYKIRLLKNFKFFGLFPGKTTWLEFENGPKNVNILDIFPQFSSEITDQRAQYHNSLKVFNKKQSYYLVPFIYFQTHPKYGFQMFIFSCFPRKNTSL